MVDRDGLENRCACKRTVGSNPTLSAILPAGVSALSAAPTAPAPTAPALSGVAGKCGNPGGQNGGEGGIRTHGTLARTTVFETVPIDHSGTPPGTAYRGAILSGQLGGWIGQSSPFRPGIRVSGVDLGGLLRIFRPPSAGHSGPPRSLCFPASWAWVRPFPYLLWGGGQGPFNRKVFARCPHDRRYPHGWKTIYCRPRRHAHHRAHRGRGRRPDRIHRRADGGRQGRCADGGRRQGRWARSSSRRAGRTSSSSRSAAARTRGARTVIVRT